MKKVLISVFIVYAQIFSAFPVTHKVNNQRDHYFKNLGKAFSRMTQDKKSVHQSSLSLFRSGKVSINPRKNKMKIRLPNEAHTFKFRPKENSVHINGVKIPIEKLDEHHVNMAFERGIHRSYLSTLTNKMINILFPEAIAGGIRHKHWTDISFMLARVSLYSCLLIIPIPIAFPLFFLFHSWGMKLA